MAQRAWDSPGRMRGGFGQQTCPHQLILSGSASRAGTISLCPVGPMQRLAKQERRKRIRPCRVSLIVPGMATSPELLPDGECLQAGTLLLITSFKCQPNSLPSPPPLHCISLCLHENQLGSLTQPSSWLRGASPVTQGSLRPRAPYLPVYRVR